MQQFSRINSVQANKVMAVLAGGKPMTLIEIASAAYLTPDQTNLLLRQLKERGRVRIRYTKSTQPNLWQEVPLASSASV